MAREFTANQQRQRNPVHALGRLSANAKEALRLLDSMAADDCSCFGPSERVREFHIQRLNNGPSVPVRIAFASRRENPWGEIFAAHGRYRDEHGNDERDCGLATPMVSVWHLMRMRSNSPSILTGCAAAGLGVRSPD